MPNPVIVGLTYINTMENGEEMTSEESKEEERKHGTEGKTFYPKLGNWCTHRGWRTQWKTEKKKERFGGVLQNENGSWKESTSGLEESKWNTGKIEL